MRVWLAPLITSALASCGFAASPAKWALKAETELRCDMTPPQVEALVGRKVVTREVSRFWNTHDVEGDSGTEVALGFQSGLLKFVQISWPEQMTRMAHFQRIDLCGTAAPAADLTHRMPQKSP